MSDPSRPSSLSYRGSAARSSVAAVEFTRHGDELTITIPPRWLVGQLIQQSLVLLPFALPLLATAYVLYETISAGVRPSPFPLFLLFFLLIYFRGSARAVRRLIFLARAGHIPATIRASPGGVNVRAQGRLEMIEFALAKEQIRDVRVNSTIGYSLIDPFLALDIVCFDDAHYSVTVPWRTKTAMIEVEYCLRDVLGLPPPDELSAACVRLPIENGGGAKG